MALESNIHSRLTYLFPIRLYWSYFPSCKKPGLFLNFKLKIICVIEDKDLKVGFGSPSEHCIYTFKMAVSANGISTSLLSMSIK